MNECDVKLYWLFPETYQELYRQRWARYYDKHRQAAAINGFDFQVATVDDIQIIADGSRKRAFIKGVDADPESTLIHNKVYPWPTFQLDIWRYVALCDQLKYAGYPCIVRTDLNLMANDKMASLLALGAVARPVLPTVSIFTRDFDDINPSLLESAGIGYPVVVKPAHWAKGMGVVRAYDEAQLVMALRLAAASELTMIVQPMLDIVADIRVYCIDGTPKYGQARKIGRNRTVANTTSGGTYELGDVPEYLMERTRKVADVLDTPWLGVDYLQTADETYFSEVEIDAGLPVSDPMTLPILTERFASYRRLFDGGFFAAHANAPDR